MKKLTILFVCLVVAVLSYAVWKFVFPHDKAIDLDRIESLISEGTIEAAIDGERVSFIDGNFTSQTVADSTDAASVLNSASALFGDFFHADAEDFISQPYDDGAFQANYYRYCPSVNGVPVLGSQIVLSADSDANVTGLFSSYVPEIGNVDTAPTITAEEAEQIAVDNLLNGEVMSDFFNALANRDISREDAVAAVKSGLNIASDLLVYALDDTQEPVLVYAVSVDNFLMKDEDNADINYENYEAYEALELDEEIRDVTLIPMVSYTYYVAANGENVGYIIMSVEQAQYSGSVTYKDNDDDYKKINVYEKYGWRYLTDLERNITLYQSRKGFFSSRRKTYYVPSVIVAYDTNVKIPEILLWAQYHVSKSYDFYKNYLNWNSYDGKGSKIKVLLNVGTINNNMGWNSFKNWMEIGSGEYPKALDVVGHEFTHGVFNSVAKGIGKNTDVETKALNEAYADIMGSLIESDLYSDKNKWINGEDSCIGTDGTINNILLSQKRNFANPSEHKCLVKSEYNNGEQYAPYPDKYSAFSNPMYSDEHDFPTIFSHAAYLMMTDKKTSQITDKTWAKVFFDSMFYLTSTAKFTDARNAVLVAARNHHFHPVQIQAIREAFDDVEIYTNVSKYGYELLAIKGRVIDQNTKASVVDISIKVTDKQSGEEMPPAAIDESGEFLAGVFWIFSDNETPTAEYFWEHYSIEITKDGYNGVTLSSGLDTLSGNIYDIGTIQLTPTVPDDESSEFVLAKRDSSSGLTVEKTSPADIDIALLPEADALNVFLADFDFGFSYGADKYDFTDESVHEQVNILDRVMESYFLGNEPYEWMEITPIEPDSVQIQSQWMYFGRYKSEDVDWFLRNIFNCSDETIQKMREASGVNPDDHNYYYDDGSYYRPDIGIGGSVYPFIVSAKYDGEFYHLVYDAFSEIDFPSPDSYEGRHYAVLKLKDIDGKNYWSIYQWQKSAPESFGDVASYSYKKASDESFWRGNYQEAVEILQVGHEKTGDSSLQERLDDMKSFLKNYGNDDYHYDYYTDSYTEYPYISAPTAVENLMGLSGFYVTSRPGGMHQQDFYVFSPAEKMIQVGETWSSIGLSRQDDFEGFFVRDVDGDGITELICHAINTSTTVYVYRMKNGVIEKASLSYEDVERLAPPDRQEGGNREGMSWYDGDTDTFYLQYSVERKLNADGGYDTEYGYLEYHDLSPFVFYEYNVYDSNQPETQKGLVQAEDLTWALDSDGLLTISGVGEMKNYATESDVPWSNLVDSIISVAIENGVTSVGDYSFMRCDNLIRVALPDSVTYIGERAFSNCANLTDITLPDKITNIGDFAFYSCYRLKSLEIPKSVTNIGNGAFCYSGLTSVVLPEGITQIGRSTFSYCHNLSSVKIPNGVINIGDYAFSDCRSLKTLSIPNSVTAIGEGAFTSEHSGSENCCGITEIIIPEGLTSIGDFAFMYCYHLKSVTIPDSVTSIGKMAFMGCDNLTSVIIPANTKIAEEAFSPNTSVMRRP